MWTGAQFKCPGSGISVQKFEYDNVFPVTKPMQWHRSYFGRAENFQYKSIARTTVCVGGSDSATVQH